MRSLFPHRPSVSEIQADQIRLLYSNANYGYLATAINAVLLALIQRPVISPYLVAPWLAFMLALTVFRVALERRFHRVNPSAESIKSWGNLFLIGAILSGLGWGSAGILLFPDSSVIHQVFLAFVLGGMVAGAVGLLATNLVVFASFVGPIAVSIVFRLLTTGQEAAVVMAGMYSLFSLVMVLAAWKSHSTIVLSLKLRYENSELLAALTSNEAALVDARSHLEQQVKERTGQLETTIARLRSEMEERQRLNEQLQQAQKMETIGLLAGGIAHDFNNLLTVMLGYTEMARRSASSSPVLQNCLGEIHNSARRGTDLVQQLLAFSRRQIINPEIICLNDMLLDMVPMLRRVITEDIELVTIPDAKLWANWADPGQIQRVVMNLALNARDAMPAGGKIIMNTENVHIEDSGSASSPEVKPGDYTLLMVCDTGIGIAEDVKSRVFEPFFTTKDVGEGTGLGLSSSYGIITQMGGFMRIESEVGRGTTIRVFLPKAEGAWEIDDGKSSPFPISRGDETLLVVEDEAMVRNLICEVLRSNGYRVLQAMNGLEALEEVRRHPEEPVNLLITDVVMPQMGGLELAAQIRAMWPGVPILFVSGYTNPIDSAELAGLGGNFLQKPFLPDQLVRKVSQVLTGV